MVPGTAAGLGVRRERVAGAVAVSDIDTSFATRSILVGIHLVLGEVAYSPAENCETAQGPSASASSRQPHLWTELRATNG
jgi:hypothetical protein